MTIEKQTATSIVTWRRESHLGLKMSYPDSYQVTMGKENLIDSHLFPLKFCSCSQVFLSCKTLKALSSSNVTNGEVPCSKLHGKCSTCVCVCEIISTYKYVEDSMSTHVDAFAKFERQVHDSGPFYRSHLHW